MGLTLQIRYGMVKWYVPFFFYLTADSPWKGRQREAELGCYWEIILSCLKPNADYEVLCTMGLFYFIMKVNAIYSK